MNTLQPEVDGPIRIEGEAELYTAEGSLIERAQELCLCRCGRSGSKPYCDGSHKDAGFRDAGAVSPDYKSKSTPGGAPGPCLRLTLMPNGPVRCFGNMEIRASGGRGGWVGVMASLCRCGESSNKPFCDGTHRDNGFASD
jgi:CDGSH-type Zn-finger protein